MPKQYKQKFLVPSETLKKDAHQTCRNCRGNSRDFPCNPRGGSGISFNYGPVYENCHTPDKLFAQYIVSETEDGRWECSCPAWKFRRMECHHIRKAKANPEKYRIAKEFTGRTTDVLSKIFQS